MTLFKRIMSPIDMTKGEPWKNILLFSIPLLIGNFAQQLYSTVDSIVVGHYVGDNALASVGSAGPIFNLALVFFIGISVGVTVLVAQYFGAKDKEGLAVTIGNCITLTFFSSLLIMALGFFGIRPLLELLGTPESLIDWANDYLFIFAMGIAGLAYFNILSGILRGLGDSISALKYLLVSTVINIVLDILFVGYLGMEVAGVSLATVIANTVSAVLCYRKLISLTDIFVLEKRHFKIHKETLSKVLKLGMPSGLTQMIFSMAMILTQALVNSFGELYITANVIVMRVDSFAIMPIFSFANALTTFAGQNVGAKQFDRLLSGSKSGIKLSILTSFIISIVLIIFGPNLMALFTDTKEIIETSYHFMLILSFGYLALSLSQAVGAVLRGSGDAITPMWISIFTTVIFRVPLAYLFAYLTKSELHVNGNPVSNTYSLLISWLLGALFSLYFFNKKNWYKKALETK